MTIQEQQLRATLQRHAHDAPPPGPLPVAAPVSTRRRGVSALVGVLVAAVVALAVFAGASWFPHQGSPPTGTRPTTTPSDTWLGDPATSNADLLGTWRMATYDGRQLSPRDLPPELQFEQISHDWAWRTLGSCAGPPLGKYSVGAQGQFHVTDVLSLLVGCTKPRFPEELASVPLLADHAGLATDGLANNGILLLSANGKVLATYDRISPETTGLPDVRVAR
jgi:hypothetical protein